VGLLNSLPGARGKKKKRLAAIPGVVPNPLHLPGGCRFRDRCPKAQPLCADAEPPLIERESGHWVACYFPETEQRPAI
jgi:oligopeptide/dipeptide ABC transporter ATP-binding protein